jgi:hypothetical protein
MNQLNLTAIVLATGLLLGCVTPPTPLGLGESKTTAIEVCRPQGQHAYLNRLQCSDGSTPSYSRIGNVGERSDVPKKPAKEPESIIFTEYLITLKPGEADYHIVDKYELSCGSVKRIIFMDMYHCIQSAPTEAPSGFKLRTSSPLEAPPRPPSLREHLNR